MPGTYCLCIQPDSEGNVTSCRATLLPASRTNAHSSPRQAERTRFSPASTKRDPERAYQLSRRHPLIGQNTTVWECLALVKNTHSCTWLLTRSMVPRSPPRLHPTFGTEPPKPSLRIKLAAGRGSQHTLTPTPNKIEHRPQSTQL